MTNRNKSEFAHSIAGVSGRLFGVRTYPGPDGLISSQRWISEARPVAGYGEGATLNVELRFDDQCKNGKLSFAITGEVRGKPIKTRAGYYKGQEIAFGCLHDDISATFPELAYLIQWHLCGTDGPMHYVTNTLYHAGDRDSRLWCR